MYKEIGFSECDIMDGFFDSLKEDYPGFESWFEGKSRSGATAFVSKDEDGKVEAFVYVKDEECEAVGNLLAEPRMKIGTIKISPGSEGTRLGEGGIGLALWKWQRSPLDQIYLTVFPKQEKLIGLIERYGFVWKGDKGGERVYLKDKRELDYSDSDIPWLKSFPYLDPDFKRGVYISIYAGFHDNMFAYSELSNTEQRTDPLPVANGVMKVYIATPKQRIVCDHSIAIHYAYSLRRPVPVRARDNTTVLAKDLANGGPLLLSDGLEHASFMKPSQPMESCGYVRSETVVVVQPVDLRGVFPYYLLHRPIHQVVPGARLLAPSTVRYSLADDIRRDAERDASRPATSCLAGEFGYLVSEKPDTLMGEVRHMGLCGTQFQVEAFLEPTIL